jgi:hypothetical protein
MTDVTQILSDIEHGNSAAAERLLPLVYNELQNSLPPNSRTETRQTCRRRRWSQAYIRPVDVNARQQWNTDITFCRRLRVNAGFIERGARSSVRHGGEQARRLDVAVVAEENRSAELLAVHERWPSWNNDVQAATSKLRHFAGLSHSDAAERVKSCRVADLLWVAARTVSIRN